MYLYEIDEQIKAICPIDGVNSNGVIHFKPEATQEQRDTAIALMQELLPQLAV